MNLDNCIFNIPDYVSSADAGNFDTSAPGAVVVGGYRLDNPAAVWVAGADMRKKASAMDEATITKIATACDLFGISDADYQLKKLASVTVSDGENTAEFNVYDDDSLNKAAETLLSKRASLPYAFAHDCAIALQEEAMKNAYRFNKDTQVAIRKLAGDYTVDFKAGKSLLEDAAKEAASMGLEQHAEVLSKLASMCTDDCTADMAPYFIVALDEFNRSGVHKEASIQPEDIFYLSNSEALAKHNSEQLPIDSKRYVARGEVLKRASAISKWASICGYKLDTTDADSVVAAVSKMPNALKDEFVELFS